MIKTYNIIKEELYDYDAPDNKICRMVKEGKYIKLTKGLYESPSTPGYLVAGALYGPSYLSFDYALSYYGLIPEGVYVFTSATFEKKKTKEYITELGTFTYRDVPSKAYPLGIKLIKEDNYYYQIATPEKALCDKLYSLPPIKTKKEMKKVLFDDLRIDIDEFEKLNKDDLKELCDLYNCTNTKVLKKLVR